MCALLYCIVGVLYNIASYRHFVCAIYIPPTRKNGYADCWKLNYKSIKSLQLILYQFKSPDNSIFETSSPSHNL